MDLTARKLVLLYLIACPGCSSSSGFSPVVQEEAALMLVAPHSIPEHELLDIDIRPFAPIPETFANRMEAIMAGDGIFGVEVPHTRTLREAESHYLSRELSGKLQESGHWGRVRLNPYGMSSADLEVTGTVLHSDGQSLRLQVEARDARGELWLSRRYTQLSPSAAAASSVEGLVFPFTDLFNQIANDLATARAAALNSKGLAELRQHAALKFAASLAPSVFAPYRQDGALVRLPAQDDPMFQSVQEMRLHNETFLDAMQGSYDLYIDQIARDYLRFLYVGRQVAGQFHEYLQSDDDEKILSRLPTRSSRYMAIYERALADMTQPLHEAVAPLTLEFNDRTAQLSGTLENQFRQWQVILLDMYEVETGTQVYEDHANE